MLLDGTNLWEAFDYMVNVVLQVLNESPIYLALEKSGDNNIMAMITLHDCDIDSLTYDKNNTEQDTPSQKVT